MRADDHAVTLFVEVALFSVLFADGMKIGIKDLWRVWELPGRALLLGLPLTLIFMALLAHLVLRLGWLELFLVGAVLSPTDPVFASGFVSHPSVPRRLRRLLNVESGLNDGLALPLVLLMLSLLGVEAFKVGNVDRRVVDRHCGGNCSSPVAVLNLKRIKLFAISRVLQAHAGSIDRLSWCTPSHICSMGICSSPGSLQVSRLLRWIPIYVRAFGDLPNRLPNCSNSEQY